MAVFPICNKVPVIEYFKLSGGREVSRIQGHENDFINNITQKLLIIYIQNLLNQHEDL